MEFKISSQFASDVKEVEDGSLHEMIKRVIEKIKHANTIAEITQFRSVGSKAGVYKMGVGFYYLLAIQSSEQELTLMRFLHRDLLMRVIV
ncbi:hypothetical protein M0D21_16760 [Aquimarina sp. D1M17]|uniref:hypothetical protein n=1 Tax=Aquimarina acroporae TaxID=2937283 RepID=UPI0020BF8FEB|nr:hypothetical protein [Aquimarina acroporae]MCK8523233.1 hypothetical protein [Aquimarina acroporae]